MDKTLVTGASGFTGSHLCRRLVENGKDVVAFVRSSSHITNLEDMGVKCVVVDIKDKESVNDNFSGINKVYHLAATYRAEYSDRSEFWKVNVEATKNLLDAAALANIKRFVHCSTVGVQGEIEDPPADEDYRFAPGDHYQESKLKGELLARKYFKKGLPGVVVRPVGIYGPGDTRFLKLFKPISRGYFVMIGSGKTLYHMTYIDDLIQGILLAGQKREALGEVFTIAGKTYTTLRELVNLIADVLKKPHPTFRVPYYPVYLTSIACSKIFSSFGFKPPLYPRRVEFFIKDRAFSIEKARKVLGYHPQIDLGEGLVQTALWYHERGLI